MRVLFVIDSLGAGGAERSLVESLPSMPAHGVTPTVVCLYHREIGFEDEAVRRGFDVRFLTASTHAGRVWQMRQLIRATRPDLVHTCLFEADVIGRVAAAGTSVPVLSSVVNTSYGIAHRQNPGLRDWKLQAARAIDGWTARHLTAHVHAITDAVAASVTSTLRVPMTRVTVIERGRDPQRLGVVTDERRRDVRRRLGLAQDTPIVLNVARQEYQKGQQVLLHAAAALRETHPDVTWLVAGRPGGASRDLQRLHARLDLGDQVRFLGHRDDVPDLLAAADVFAFPSLYEGLGGAVIEALAIGVPVVASDLPALRDVLDDGRCGLLVPHSDTRALADGVARMLDDAELHDQVVERGRSVFEDRFTIERSVRRLVDLYADLTGGHDRHAAVPCP